MNFSEEWRFLWPASQSSHAPSVLSSSVGPLLVRPLPATQSHLLSSKSLLPPPLLPLPSLSLSRFLQTSSSILHTTSTAISIPSSSTTPPPFSTNCLEPLPYPDRPSTLLFFSTGHNSDRVGFVLLEVLHSQLRVQPHVFLSSNKLGHRILQLAAREAADDDAHDCLGFLMAATMYSLQWFRVSLAAKGTNSERPVLVLLATKLFKTSPIAHVCWSPHLPEESLVLLQTGDLFLFDISDGPFLGKGKRVLVSWDQHDKDGGWLSCEFSWHPRIVVVANSHAVFLVDLRSGKCSVDCLMKISLLGKTDVVETDRFLAFSKAGSDGFYFVVVSQCWLVLIDIRVPCRPALQWMHNHQYPCYVSVYQLSRLRGNLGNEEYNQASKMGYAIILGSFWTGDFTLFCYGPSLKQQRVSVNEPIKVSNPFYAWDLPSEFSLSGLESACSSCLLRKELAKDNLPDWIHWQQKKELVFGFFIPDKAMSSLLSKEDGDAAGFLMIRLVSSGKLESQRYSTCTDMPNKVECAHVEPPFNATDFHLCSMEEEEEKYRFDKTWKSISLDYLYAYMSGSLTDVLISKFNSLHEGIGISKRPAAPTQESTSSYYSVSDAVRDISLPISIYEAASKKMWTRLPTSILGMAFLTYRECKKVFLELSAENQLPPFTLREPCQRSNKRSKRDDLVGPVIPLPVSLTLKEICEKGHSYIGDVDEFSADMEITRECQHVLHISRELCVCHSNIVSAAAAADVYTVPDIKEETWNVVPDSEEETRNVVPDSEEQMWNVVPDSEEQMWNVVPDSEEQMRNVVPDSEEQMRNVVPDSEEHMWNVVPDSEEETRDVARSNKSLYLYKPSAFSYALPNVENLHESARYTTMIANVANDKQGSDSGPDLSNLFDALCPIDLKLKNPTNVGSKEMHAYAILEERFKNWQHNFKPYADFSAQFKRAQCHGQH